MIKKILGYTLIGVICVAFGVYSHWTWDFADLFVDKFIEFQNARLLNYE